MEEHVTGEPVREEDPAEEEGGGINLRFILGIVSWLRLALRRHWMGASAVFVLTMAAAVGFVELIPRTYNVWTSIRAERNQIIATLGNPTRPGFGNSMDSPTRAASDLILRQDNLVALAKQTNLLESWYKHRAFAGRVMDIVRRIIHGPLNDEEKADAVVTVLGRKMYVNANDDKVVIGINWPDPNMAYRLVDAAQQNYLESRHVREISMIAESISILESHAKEASDDVQDALKDVRQRTTAAAPARRAKTSEPARSADDQELARLQVMLAAKRRALSDLEEFRRKRLSELQAQLAEQKAIYSDSHPVVVNLEESIRALNQDSPQVVALRREEQDLEAEFQRRGGVLTPEGTGDSDSRAGREPIVIDRATRTDVREDYGRQRLNAAISRYNILLDRISNARMELDAARAVYKYRYVVVRPPKHPNRPIAPNRPRYLALGLVGALAMGLITAAGLEARRGRITQSWMVERLVGLPVLAQVDEQRS